MFSYLSNLMGAGSSNKSSSSSSYNETLAVDGSLIEYITQSKNPKTVVMNAKMIIDKSLRKGRDTELIIHNKEYEKEKISFLLEESMDFSIVADQPDVIAYCWVNGDSVWVFKFSEKNYELSKCVSRLAYECIFENSHDRDFDDQTDSLDELMMESELPFDVDTLVMFKKPTTPSSDASSSTKSVIPEQVKAKETKTVPTSPVASKQLITPQSMYPSLEFGDENARKKSYEEKIGGKLEEICTSKCDLYLLDEKTHIYDLKRENATATIYEVLDEDENSNFEYIMEISTGDERLIIQDINSEMNVQFYNQFHSITWNFTKPFSSWSLIFKNYDEESNFKTTLSRCIYEFNTCNKFFKLSIEDQEMLVKASAIDQAISSGDNSKYLRELDYEDEDYVDFISDSEEEESEDEEDEVVPSKSSGKQTQPPKYTNSFMLDSSQRERTFIIRGTDIGVFKRDDDTDHPVFDTQIKNVSTTDGELFVPFKAMLHNQDRDLLFLHKDQENEHCGKVYRMDITRGEVVETWNTFKDYVPVTEIRPTEKFGDQLPTQLFGALNDNAIFALDPRVHGSDKVVGNISAITSNSKPQYSCFATTLDGRLVVGSEKGEIRMYSGIPNLDKVGKKGCHPKTAKTLLPGFGDPILGIDVTSNGEWVVATCKNYLLVIKTTMPDGSETGFTERMGKNKPVPRKIQLLPEDIKQVGGSVSFKPAKFNSGIDGELWIVTSTGPYLITWNFKRITQNNLFDYTMKKVNNNENVVMSEFKSVRINEEGRHAPIIVTTPNDVLLEKKKKTKNIPYKNRSTQYKK